MHGCRKYGFMGVTVKEAVDLIQIYCFLCTAVMGDGYSIFIYLLLFSKLEIGQSLLKSL